MTFYGRILSRFRFRFSLASALIAVSLLCMLLAWLAHELSVQNRRLALIREIENSGGYVIFDMDDFSKVGWATTVFRKIFGSNMRRPVYVVELGEYRTGRNLEKIERGIAKKRHELSETPQRTWESLTPPIRTDDDLIWLAAEFPEIEHLHLDGWDGWVVTEWGLRALRRLRNLQSLSLREITLSERGLCHVTQLEQLTELDLTRTAVADQGMHHLAQLHSLKVLYLGAGHEIGRYGISADDFGDDGVAALATLPRLWALDLSGRRVGDESLKALAHHPTLFSLNVSDTDITDQGLAHVAQMPQLGILTLSKTAVGDDSVATLATLPRLVRLDLSGTRVGDESLKAFANHPTLSSLDISDTDITDQGLAYVAQMPQLRILNLSTTAVTNQGMHHLARVLSLQILRLGTSRESGDDSDMRGADIRDDGAVALATLPGLEILDLSGTAVGDDTLKAFAHHPTLHSMDVSNTDITDQGLAHVVHMPRLRNLTLIWNQGTIPPGFSDVGVAELLAARPDLSIYYTRSRNGSSPRRLPAASKE